LSAPSLVELSTGPIAFLLRAGAAQGFAYVRRCGAAWAAWRGAFRRRRQPCHMDMILPLSAGDVPADAIAEQEHRS
jgi:hypothetical protein